MTQSAATWKSSALDVDQSLLRSVGPLGGRQDVLAQVVRVRIDTHQVNIDRQLELVGDHKVLCPCWDVERAIVLHLQQHGIDGSRLVGEIQPDARLNSLWLARSEEMRVEHQVGALVQPQRHAVGLVRRDGTRLPEKKVAVGIEYRSEERRVGKERRLWGGTN